jgi:hypothetical protein
MWCRRQWRALFVQRAVRAGVDDPHGDGSDSEGLRRFRVWAPSRTRSLILGLLVFIALAVTAIAAMVTQRSSIWSVASASAPSG